MPKTKKKDNRDAIQAKELKNHCKGEVFHFDEENPYFIDTKIIHVNIHEITIFPNPSNGIYNIKGLGKNKACDIQVINSLGNIIYHFNADNSNLIDLTNEASGLFIVKITEGLNIYYKKIIKY